jgi:hypothetical protein
MGVLLYRRCGRCGVVDPVLPLGSEEVKDADRYWPATGDRAERAIVLFHRGHEHSGRLPHFFHLVRYW